MTAHGGFKRTRLGIVGTRVSLEETLRAFDVTPIPAYKIIAYKQQLLDQYPPTRIGLWVHRNHLPLPLLQFVTGAISAILIGIGGFTALTAGGLALFIDPLPAIAVSMVGMFIGAFGYLVYHWFYRDEIHPSYWLHGESPIPGTDWNPFETPVSIIKTWKRLAYLLPDASFSIDEFFMHGKSEDPIAYVTDRLTKERVAFAIWRNGQVVTL